jgi:hypothetical protein
MHPPNLESEIERVSVVEHPMEGIEIPEMEEDEVEQFYEDPTIWVCDEVRDKMAAKALQIELDLEPCAHVEALYTRLRVAVDSMILEARRQVVPDPEKEEDNEFPDEDNDDY